MIVIFGGFAAVTVGPIGLIGLALGGSGSEDVMMAFVMAWACVGIVLSVPIAWVGPRVVLRGRGLRFEDAREVLARSV